jgi:hypothetical protein
MRRERKDNGPSTGRGYAMGRMAGPFWPGILP